MNDYRTGCNHNWHRDDQNTKQCLYCGKYAPIKDGDDL